MTATQSLNLYNIALRHFKNESDATAFVKEIETVVDNKFETKKEMLATKEDIATVRLEIKEAKTDMIKWVFAFFVALSLMIIGLYLKK
jgi:hypothetical protein